MKTLNIWTFEGSVKWVFQCTCGWRGLCGWYSEEVFVSPTRVLKYSWGTLHIWW